MANPAVQNGSNTPNSSNPANGTYGASGFITPNGSAPPNDPSFLNGPQTTRGHAKLGPRASFVRYMIRDHISKVLNRINEQGNLEKIPSLRDLYPGDGDKMHFPPLQPGHLPSRPRDSSQELPQNMKVCIIGAGMAGLYSALIFDHLGIKYDLLEANDRPGGRVLTHYFSTRKHDYYDIGAMRFPNVPPMERTFDLFARTGVPLIDYHLSGPRNPKSYNVITVFPPEQGSSSMKDDPFKVSERNGGAVPDERLTTIDSIMEEAFAPLKEALKRGDEESFEMFKELDDLTVREYLRDRMGLDYHTIQWLEETDSATGLFDMAFTEGVMDSIAFDYGPEEEEWKSVDGGTSLVVEALVNNMIKTRPTYNKRVTRVALERDAPGEDKMVVTTNYDDEPRRYDTVVNTTTLACLQRVDTTDLELTPTVKIALRALRYDSSTKVAIKFDNAWWIKMGITGAGCANTDLPIRVWYASQPALQPIGFCLQAADDRARSVYPSYNIHDDPDKPAVLLCTYTWGQDAIRVGSLVNLDSPRGEDELKGLMLYNLARLHSTTPDEFQSVYAEIKRSYITHHGFDWAMDDFSSGAFALFTPGQFRSLYPHLMRPHADARFHIVGEAASANHAWIVGSLESAYRAIWCFLERFKCYDLQERLVEEFRHVPELETGPDGVAHLLVALGMCKPDELAVEERRVFKEAQEKKTVPVRAVGEAKPAPVSSPA